MQPIPDRNLTRLALSNGTAQPRAVRDFQLPKTQRPSILTVSFKGRCEVATGTVKWFNAMKGYGFIQPDGGGKDVFVHISAVEKAGATGLAEGAKVTYEIISDR